MKIFPILFSSCLIFVSCGPKLIYNHLDQLVPIYANDYIPLNQEQRDLLDSRLEDLLEWHCRTQLPRYAAFLDRLREDFRDPERPVTHEQMRTYYQRVREAWNDLLRRVGPDAADILATADDAQIKAFYDNLAEKNREIEEKYIDISSEERVRERRKRMEKHLRRWISRLTPEQEALVAAWSAYFEPMAEDRLAYRKGVQARFLRLLKERHQDGFRETFTRLLTHFQETRTPIYQRKLNANTERTIDLLVRLGRMLTPSQRDRLRDQLESYSKTFAELSCGPEGAAIESAGDT